MNDPCPKIEAIEDDIHCQHESNNREPECFHGRACSDNSSSLAALCGGRGALVDQFDHKKKKEDADDEIHSEESQQGE